MIEGGPPSASHKDAVIHAYRGEMHDRIIRMLRRHNVAVAAV